MPNQTLINAARAANELKRRAYAKDIFLFINDLKVFEPRTKQTLPFHLYPYERDYVLRLVDCIDNGKELFVEKSRDMGVTWTTLAVFLHYWLFKENFQFLIGSRKEDEVDNRQVDTLFGKLDFFLNNLPFVFEEFEPKKHRTFMSLVNPLTGSTIGGESANPNFSRSGRYAAIFFDELAFWQFQQSSWESAGESTKVRIGVTTPSEYPSYAKSIRNGGKILVLTIHWTQHPDKTQAWYEQAKARKTDDEIARELDINWEGSTRGIVYGEIGNAQVGNFPYIPQQPLYVSWDFGRDGTAIGWWQLNRANGKWRIIDAYFFQNETLDYVFPAFGQPINTAFNYTFDDLEFFTAIAKLPKAQHVGDPDIEKSNLQTTSTNRQFLYNKAGIYVTSNTKANTFTDRRTYCKRLLQKGIEINDTQRTGFYLESMRSYRYPDRREDSQATNEIIKPVHSIHSHHATMTEYLSVNVDVEMAQPTEVHSWQAPAVAIPNHREMEGAVITRRGVN